MSTFRPITASQSFTYGETEHKTPPTKTKNTPSLREGHPTLAQRTLTARKLNGRLSPMEKKIYTLDLQHSKKTKDSNALLLACASYILESDDFDKADAKTLIFWIKDKIYSTPSITIQSARLACAAYNRCNHALGRKPLELSSFLGEN